MKAWKSVLMVFGLFILSMGFAAWLESRIVPGKMFTVRNAFTAHALIDEDPSRKCRIAPGAHIFILKEADPIYLVIHFTSADTEGTDLCPHQHPFFAREEQIKAMSGGFFERAFKRY